MNSPADDPCIGNRLHQQDHSKYSDNARRAYTSRISWNPDSTPQAFLTTIFNPYVSPHPSIGQPLGPFTYIPKPASALHDYTWFRYCKSELPACHTQYDSSIDAHRGLFPVISSIERIQHSVYSFAERWQNSLNSLHVLRLDVSW